MSAMSATSSARDFQGAGRSPACRTYSTACCASSWLDAAVTSDSAAMTRRRAGERRILALRDDALGLGNNRVLDPRPQPRLDQQQTCRVPLIWLERLGKCRRQQRLDFREGPNVQQRLCSGEPIGEGRLPSGERLHQSFCLGMLGRKPQHRAVAGQRLVDAALPQITVRKRQLGFDRLRQGLCRSREQRQGLVQISGC